jgi:hypothetical protein
MRYRERKERSRRLETEAVSGPEFKIFHGVGVGVAEIKSDTLYSVVGALSDDTYVDYSNTDVRFSVDMIRTPNRAGKAEWVKVLIDDRGIDAEGNELDPSPTPATLPLAITSIGSGIFDDPMRGAFVGAVYLERNYFLSIVRTKLMGWPDPPGDYSLLQVTSLAYSQKADALGRKGQRYHGFPAKVTGVNGNDVTVEIVERRITKSVTFRKGDATAYDPAPPGDALDGQPSLASNLAVGQSGALFVGLQTAVRATLVGPKMPISEG